MAKDAGVDDALLDTTFKVIVQNADVIANGTDGTEKTPRIMVNISESGTDESKNGTDARMNGTDEISREDPILNLMSQNKRIST